MKLPTDIRTLVTAAVMAATPLTIQAQSVTEFNPSQYLAIKKGNADINGSVSNQTKEMDSITVRQGIMTAEFAVIKGWEGKYNSYLKEARGFAESLKAATTLYADGVQTLRHLYEIQKAVSYNPEGIGASVAMNNLYVETALELKKAYNMLKYVVAKGGKENMLNGAERNEILWGLSDELGRINRKLRALAVSIAYHNLKDVWNKATQGMAQKTHAQIAGEAMERWQRAAKVERVLND